VAFCKISSKNLNDRTFLQSVYMNFGKILCKIGVHSWSKTRAHHIADSNVKDMEKYCKRCGKTKRWVAQME